MSSSIMKSLVIGASSEIGKQLVNRLCSDQCIDRVYAVSRRPVEAILSKKVSWIVCDYKELDIAKAVQVLKDEPGDFIRVFICNGILHEGDNIFPEKRLEDIDLSCVEAVFKVNAFTPLIWLKHLLEPLRSHQLCTLTLFSARVGSISDNKLGGWYSYRASKAALNMLIKTASIEYARRAKNVQLVAFHPGTTDTGLSRPFKKNVPPEKLFSADFVAAQLLSILDNIKKVGDALYIDWQANEIQW